VASSSFNGSLGFCPLGCSVCSSDTVCTNCLPGFSLNVTVCLQCDKSCLTCNITNTLECFSCQPGQNLFSGKCLSCSDIHCDNCEKNNEFCLTCKPGFTSVNGICFACADNCVKCDIIGPSFCDEDKCDIGFARIRLDKCGQCLLGCSKCLTTNVATCMQCPDGTYSASGSLCILCPVGCSVCTSNVTCSTCFKGYEISNSTCVKSCSFPCLTCDANLTCLTCFTGYALNNLTNSCDPSVSCSATNSCSLCPLGYALINHTCLKCSETSCLRCNPTNLAECRLCNETYFLDTDNSNCSSCLSPCLTCLNSKVCVSCVKGFLMGEINSIPNGICSACNSNCATCIKTATFCTSCSANFSLVGVKCVSNANIGFNLTFKSRTAPNSKT